MDPAEALRGGFLDRRPMLGGFVDVPTARAPPGVRKRQAHRSTVAEPDPAGEPLWWRRADLVLASNDMRAAFAGEIQMAAVSEVKNDPVEFVELPAMPTPEPAGWSLFGVGAVALLSRVRKGKLSSRR